MRRDGRGIGPQGLLRRPLPDSGSIRISHRIAPELRLLQLAPGHQVHKAASPSDSVFHAAIADTAPDAWGRRVIARDHAKRRKAEPQLSALTELDYLLAVDDFSRVGAL